MRVLLALTVALLIGATAAQRTTYATFGAEYDLGHDLSVLASLNTPAVNVPSIGNVGPLIQLRARTDFQSLTVTAYLGMQLSINPQDGPWAFQVYLLEKPSWTIGNDPEFTTAIGMTYTTAVPALSFP